MNDTIPQAPPGDGGDQRPAIARDYLVSVRRHQVTTLPPSVLVRECAELRRQLGLVLDAIDQAAALTEAQRAIVLAALDEAADCREQRAASWCGDCAPAPAECCPEHLDDLDQAAAYRSLARELGGDR